MIVMPTNNGKWQVHYWSGKYGGLGHLYSIGSQRTPRPHLPYALDNGAYPAFSKNIEWDQDGWQDLMCWAAEQIQRPLWALCPDVVANKHGTLKKWDTFFPMLKAYLPDVPIAFAVQDGMEVKDVPQNAEVIFVGGSTDWKWNTVEMWCKKFPRVHVGRVNSPQKLYLCESLGVESCDGTGWFRGDMTQLAGLEKFLAHQNVGSSNESVVAVGI